MTKDARAYHNTTALSLMDSKRKNEDARKLGDNRSGLREKSRAASRQLRQTLRVPSPVLKDVPGSIPAGVATRDLTPKLLVYLDGYWSGGLAERARDNPKSKALVLDDGSTRVALVISDIIA